MAEGSDEGKSRWRWLTIVAGACVGLAVLSLGLSWLEVLSGAVGLGLFTLGVIGCALCALIALFGVRRSRYARWALALGVPAPVLVAVAMASAAGAPVINDVSTDLEAPPELAHAATLEENAGRDLSFPSGNAEAIREHYADVLGGRVLETPLEEAFERALEVAREEGWRVTHSAPEEGRFEAVATTRLFHFHDDIAVRVRAAEDGGSRVDIRSKSRVGEGDMGANAERIRRFMEAL